MKIFAAVLLGIASVIYPFLWYFGRNADGGFLWLAIFMASLWVMRAVFKKEKSHKIFSFFIALFFIVLFIFRQPEIMYWYPVLMNGIMLIIFGISLFSKQSLIERIARLQNPDLPEKGVVYTRKITQIWCGFFIINGLIAALLIIFKQFELWAIYTGIISYIIMGLLLGGEWLYRKKVLKL